MMVSENTESYYFKLVDSAKVEAAIKNRYPNLATFCREIGINTHAISEIKRSGGRVNKARMNLICLTLGLPLDYFDKVEEPKPISESEEQRECLVDLADIQLSLNKIEALLLKICAALSA